VRLLIPACFGVILLIFLPLALSADFRRFINLDPAAEPSLMARGSMKNPS
jgi:hypothetical protein